VFFSRIVRLVSTTFASEEGAFPSEAPCSIFDNDTRASLFLPVHQSFIQTATSFAADIDKTQEILMQIFYLQMLVNKKTKFSKYFFLLVSLSKTCSSCCNSLQPNQFRAMDISTGMDIWIGLVLTKHVCSKNANGWQRKI
jgi:hypothetical protein